MNNFLNVLKLLVGTVGGQLSFILTLPILSRIFDNDSFAKYALCLALTNILGIVFSFRLDNLIVLKKSLKEQDNTYLNVLYISTLNLSGLFLLSILFYWVDDFLIIVVSVFSAYFFHGYNLNINLANSRENYSRVSKLRLFRPILEISIAFLLFYLGGEYYFAIPLSYFIIFLIFHEWNSYDEKLIKALNYTSFIKKNIHFVKYDLPTSISYVLAAYLPFIIIASFYSSTNLALFSIAFRAAVSPVSILIQSLGYVIRKNFVDASPQKINDLFNRWLYILIIISFCFILLVLLMSNLNLFNYLLGGNWVGVDDLVVLLLPFIALKIVSTPLSYTFFVKNRLKENMLLQIIGSGIVLFLLFFSSYTENNYKYSIIMYSFSYMLFYFLYIYRSKAILNAQS